MAMVKPEGGRPSTLRGVTLTFAVIGVPFESPIMDVPTKNSTSSPFARVRGALKVTVKTLPEKLPMVPG
jgi:hypothetical protein